jgi:oxygen-independent coproporphyrinogen-3 oxidase
MYIHPLYHWPPKPEWKYAMRHQRQWNKMGAYIHFPFCGNICDFCNYETRLIDKRSANEFASSLLEEIKRYGDRDDFPAANIASLFFGGGTASLMLKESRAAAIEALLSLTGQSGISEVTLECEPGTISRTKLSVAHSVGVNRVCVCAQSFNDQELKRITRRHSSAEALQLLEDALSLGIENIHVDLMYGLQDQSIDDWRRTVEFTASLPIKHISAYKLYIFKHGALHRGKVLPRPEEEDVERTNLLEEMHDLALQTFEAAGFRQYTLTEFARPGYECKYLLDTFGGRDILPIGPSAFGRCGNEVWQNSGLVHLYGKSAEWDARRRAYSFGLQGGLQAGCYSRPMATRGRP